MVIVGGGFAGMLTAIDLREAGRHRLPHRREGRRLRRHLVLEPLPGLHVRRRVATIYLPLLEETGYMPTEKYASASEIFGYCQLLGRHFDLYPHALFQTEVDTADVGRRRARAGRSPPSGATGSRTRFFVTAGGVLHKAKLPGIAGIDDFAGRAFHTSRWDYAYTGGSPTEPMDRLADKGVGIIGTGATVDPGGAAAGPSRRRRSTSSSAPRPRSGVRGQRPDRRGVVRAPAAGLAGRAHAQLHPGGHRRAARPDLVGDGWTKVLWRRHPDEAPTLRGGAAELERSDFEVMEALPAPDRRDRRGPRDRRAAQALVRQALQAALLPRRVPASRSTGRTCTSSTPTGAACGR